MKFQDMQNLKKVTESLENVFKELQWSDTDVNLEVFENFVTLTFSDSFNHNLLQAEFGHLNTFNLRFEQNDSLALTFNLDDCNL